MAKKTAAGKYDSVSYVGKSDSVSLLPESDSLSAFTLNDEAHRFASSLGVSLDGSLDARVDSAADLMNRAQRSMLAAGLLLVSVKAECQHGEFLDLIAARGFEVRSAQRAMLYAEYVASKPEAERELLIGMPRGKVLALAGADPEVIEALRASGVQIDALTVQALHQKIGELEKAIADRDVQIETAEANATAAKKEASRQKDREGEVPIAIFDVRAEAVAQGEQARLAVSEFEALGRDLTMMIGQEGVYTWVGPTARLAVAAMAGLRLQLDGVIQKYVDAFNLEDIQPQPISYLKPDEVLAAAQKYADLVAINDHQKALRDWERKAARPQGKGRPAAKPPAPKLYQAL